MKFVLVCAVVFCVDIPVLQSQLIHPHVQTNALPNFVAEMNCTVKVISGKIASAPGVTLSGPYVKISKEGWTDSQTRTSTSTLAPTWNHLITYPNCDNSFYGSGLKCNLYNNYDASVIANGTYTWTTFSYSLTSDNPNLTDLILTKKTNNANVTVGLIATVKLTPCTSRLPINSSCSSPVDPAGSTCYLVGTACSLCSGTSCNSCQNSAACASKGTSCVFSNNICQLPGSSDTCSSSACSSCSGPVSCAGKSGCTWGDGCVETPTPTPLFDCSTLLNQDICKRELSCRWSGGGTDTGSGSCVSDACFRANTVASVGTCTGTCTSSTVFVVNSASWRMCYDGTYHGGASSSCSYKHWTQASGFSHCEDSSCDAYGDGICLESGLSNLASDTCSASYCSSCTGPTSCGQKDGCSWSSSGCEDSAPLDTCTSSACTSCTGETSCGDRGGCVWNGGCAEAPATDRCTADYCSSCNGPTSCSSLGGCAWDSTTGGCTSSNAPTPDNRQDCASLLNAEVCQRELSCRWSASSGSCSVDACFRAGSKTAVGSCTGTCTSSEEYTYNGVGWKMCYDLNYHTGASTSCSYRWWTQAAGFETCQDSGCTTYGDQICLETGLQNEQTSTDTCADATCSSCTGPTSCRSKDCLWDNNGCADNGTPSAAFHRHAASLSVDLLLLILFAIFCFF